MGEDEGAGDNELVELLRPFWSASRTMDALALDEAGLDQARAAGDLLALISSDNRVPIFPVGAFAHENLWGIAGGSCR